MLRYDETTCRMSILFSCTRIYLFPAVHLNFVELIGYDKCKLIKFANLYKVPLKKAIEITYMHNHRYYLLNEKNHVKVWNLETGKMTLNFLNKGKDYTSYYGNEQQL
jgi:hypothetical protein